MDLHEADFNSDWESNTEYLLNSGLSRRTMDDTNNKAHPSLIGTNDNFTLAFVPLPQLVYQLLKNCSQQSVIALQNVGAWIEAQEGHPNNDPVLNLLITFQRLLLIRMFSEKELINPSSNRILSRYFYFELRYLTIRNII